MGIQKRTFLVVSAMLISSLVPAAAAAEASEPAHVRAPMVVGDIDEGQARRAGNTVRVEDGYKVLRDGTTGEEIARVPLPGGRQEGPTTQGTVYGECGYSYINLWDSPAALEGEWATGFHVYGSAYDFDWSIEITSPYSYFGWTDWGPMWPDDDWTSGIQPVDFPSSAWGEWHFAEVVSGVAYLTDGRVCYSGLPSEGAVLY